jgi:hypothetical protein
MAKTVVHEIVERIIVKDDSSSVFSRVGGHLDALQKKSVGARLGMMALSGGLTLAVRAAQAAAVAFAATLASAGALGVYLAGRGLKQMIQEEQATLALTGALQSQGVYTDELRDKLLDLASAQQYQLGVADDAIIAADAYLISLGIQSDKIGELNTAIAALSAAMKMDFESAARLVGKSLTGMAGALGRYGIQLDQSMSQEERANSIIEQTRKFLPLLAAQVNSTAGVWRVFQLAVDDGTQGLWKNETAVVAIRDILKALIPVVRTFGERFADALVGTSDNADTAREHIRNFAITAIKSFGALLDSVVPVADAFLGFSRLLVNVGQLATAWNQIASETKWGGYENMPGSIGYNELMKARENAAIQWTRYDTIEDSILLLGNKIEVIRKTKSEIIDDAVKAIEALEWSDKGKPFEGAAGGLDETAAATAKAVTALNSFKSTALEIKKALYSGVTPETVKLDLGFGKAMTQEIALQKSISYEMSLVNEQRQKQNDLMEQYKELTAEVNYDYELQITLINQLGSSIETVGHTFSDVFVGGIMGDVINMRQAIESLIRSLLGGLINSLIRFAAQQLIGAMTTRLQAAALALEAKNVYKLAAAYWALAVAKMVATVGGGAAGSIGGGAAAGAGAIAGAMHSGGYVDRMPRAHSGLKINEVGPFVLQRGEFVLRKEAVRSIGAENVAQMNRTGAIGSNATFNVVINTQPGQDGADLWDEIKRAANRDMRTGGFTIPLNALERR